MRPARAFASSLLIVLSFAILVVLPLGLVLGQAVMPHALDTGSWALDLAGFRRAIILPRNMIAFGHTLTLSAAAAFTSTVLGTLYAILLARTDLPCRRLLAATPWLVFLTPGYLKGLAWVLLVSPGGFLAQIGLMTQGISDDFFGIGGLVFLHTLTLFPMAAFVVGGALAGMGSEFEDAARTVGASALNAWLRINLPLLGSAVMLAYLATLASVASDFGMASTIARTADFGLLPYSIYTAIETYPVDFPLAGSQAMLLLAMLSAVLLLDRMLRRQRRARLITGRTRPARIHALGRWRWLAGATLALVSLLSVYLPLLAITIRAGMRTLGQGLVERNLTWKFLDAATTTGSPANEALLRSLWMAALAALICGVAALLLAWMLDQGGKFMRTAVLAVSMGAIAIPGVVMALGHILVWSRLPGFASVPIYGRWPLLVLAYIGGGLPYALVIVLGAMGQISPGLIEAARLYGARSATLLWRIVVPLVALSLVTAILYVFVHTVFELPMSTLLQPISGPPAPAVIVRMFGGDQDGIGSALSLMAILATTVSAGLLWLLARRLGRSFWRTGLDRMDAMPGRR